MLVLVVEPFPRRSPLLKRSFSSSGPVQVKAVSRLTDIASASPPPDVLVIELVDSAETARFLMARPDRKRKPFALNGCCVRWGPTRCSHCIRQETNWREELRRCCPHPEADRNQ